MTIEPFIGTKISLISKVGIRYEGSLHSLNTDDSTIVLNDVRCMGTEGRSKGQEVPPSNKVHDFVVFRGEDVSDIVVNDSKPPEDDNTFEDPAIFKTYKKDEFKGVDTSVKTETNRKTHLLKEVGIATTPLEPLKFNEKTENKNKEKNVDNVMYNEEKNKENKKKEKEKDLETFQFDELENLDTSSFPISRPLNPDYNRQDDTLENLDGSSESRRLEQDLKNECKVFYDKKSFYDNLSHEKQLSKSDLKQEHMKQREIDIATFGKFSIRNWQNRNNSYRGRRFSNTNQFNVKAGWEKSHGGNRNNN